MAGVRFLCDENFNRIIIRGVLLRLPDLDVIRVQEVGLRTADDPAILEWATQNDRILLTHDRATMPDFAYNRITQNMGMAGVFVVQAQMPVRQAFDELVLLATCSQPDEWQNMVVFLPL